MKKVFVSCPMRGLSDEIIEKTRQKMKKIAEIYEGEELELIDNFIETYDDIHGNIDVAHLSRSIGLLAEADVFIGIEYSDYYSECRIEKDVAYSYGIKVYTIDLRNVCREAYESEREFWNVQTTSKNEAIITGKEN